MNRVATALRHLRQSKFTTLVNLLCLAIGMSCFAAACGVVGWFNSADRHHANADRILFVTEALKVAGAKSYDSVNEAPSWGLAPRLRTDFPELTVARARPARSVDVSAGPGNNAYAQAAFVDAQFLDIFDLNFVSGEARTALRSPRTAVVAESLAHRLFGTRDATGRTLQLANGTTVQITGVTAEQEQPSHFGSVRGLWNYELLVSMDVYETRVRSQASPEQAEMALNGWYTNSGNFTYVLLPTDGSLDRTRLNERLVAFARRHTPSEQGEFSFVAQPIRQLQAVRLDGIVRTENTGLSGAATILILGTLILFVSCLNYANLAAAQATQRMKEVALRRVVGAGRAEVVREYLVEAGLLAGCAMILTVLIVAGASLLSVQRIGISLLTGLSQSPAFLLAGLVLTPLLASVYPAYVVSRVTPANALRAGRVTSGPRSVQTALVGIQFGAASLLLTAVLIMISQTRELQREGLGLRGEPVIAIGNSLDAARVDLDVLRQELMRRGHVETVSAYDQIPGSEAPGNRRVVSLTPDVAAANWVVYTNAVQQDFFETFDLAMLAGRAFSRSHQDEFDPDDAADRAAPINVVINRKMAEQAGWSDPQRAIGQLLHSHATYGELEMPMRVVGVVETRPLHLLGLGTDSAMYTLEPQRAQQAVVRLNRAHVAEALADIDEVWKQLAPDLALRRLFVDEVFATSMQIFLVINVVFGALAGFAFLISVMGLTGMAIHVTARRTREIGVRKTLGAGVGRVLALLLTDFSRPVVIANLLTWPLVFVVMQGYLSLFMNRASLTPAPFLLGLLITMAIAWCAVGVQTVRAAQTRPADVLRCE
jgi:putative ABC transport system permease protein